MRFDEIRSKLTSLRRRLEVLDTLEMPETSYEQFHAVIDELHDLAVAMPSDKAPPSWEPFPYTGPIAVLHTAAEDDGKPGVVFVHALSTPGNMRSGAHLAVCLDNGYRESELCESVIHVHVSFTPGHHLITGTPGPDLADRLRNEIAIQEDRPEMINRSEEF